MTDIIPAVLPNSYEALAQDLAHIKGIARMVQVDVVSDIFEGEEGLPDWEEFDFEFDIYIEPASFVARAVELGANSVIVHARHAGAKEAIETLQQYRQGSFAVKVGVALRPADDVSLLEHYKDQYDLVQVMGIDHEGHQGEAFNPKAIELVQALRQAYPDLFIQVDGHAAGHERELAQAGATRLVEGSAIVGSDNPKSALKEAYTRVNGSH